MKRMVLVGVVSLGMLTGSAIAQSATDTTTMTKQQLKSQEKADKQQAKADKAQKKALGTKEQKKADKAQNKANKQAAKAAAPSNQ